MPRLPSTMPVEASVAVPPIRVTLPVTVPLICMSEPKPMPVVLTFRVAPLSMVTLALLARAKVSIAFVPPRMFRDELSIHTVPVTVELVMFRMSPVLTVMLPFTVAFVRLTVSTKASATVEMPPSS